MLVFKWLLTSFSILIADEMPLAPNQQKKRCAQGYHSKARKAIARFFTLRPYHPSLGEKEYEAASTMLAREPIPTQTYRK